MTRAKKSIGILNFHFSPGNYGAVLQAYALSAYLSDAGYYPLTIDLRPRPKQRRIKGSIQYFLNKFIMMQFNDPFECFLERWLPRSEPYYTTEELEKADFSFDAYIVGSDQVWRPEYTYNQPLAYFLSFVKPPARKVAYAASFGLDHWQEKNTPELTAKVKALLRTFHAISVREDSGVSICKQTFDVGAVHVLDPTLLVGRSYFDRIIGSKKKKPSKIIAYKLDNDIDFLRSMNVLSQALALPKKNIYVQERMILGKTFHRSEPVDVWLASIRDAELVVTDSYHGICFCILFEKQFIYYPNPKRGMARLESLLGLLGLKNRIYTNSQDISERQEWLEKIEYSKVNDILAEQRAISRNFLFQAL